MEDTDSHSTNMISGKKTSTTTQPIQPRRPALVNNNNLNIGTLDLYNVNQKQAQEYVDKQ